LKRHPGLRGNTYFNVFTVDSYQGEENDIILLSLVRSNEELGIGFLDSKNRLVVALSRARRGLYIFGNAITLTAAETSERGLGRDVLWTPVINFLKSQGRFDLDDGLPITCSNHGTTLSIMEADQWLGLAGGCDEPCGGILECGHGCPLKCHPFEHDLVLCRKACPRILECGHGCSHFCSDACQCSLCEKTLENTTNRGNESFSRTQQKTNPPHNIIPGVSSREPTFLIPNKTTHTAGPGAPDRWQEWDAAKSDAEIAEKARKMEAEYPRVDYSKLVFNDTWRPISLEKGERAVTGPERKSIRRYGSEGQSPNQGASVQLGLMANTLTIKSSDEDAVLTGIVSQMPALSLSSQDPERTSRASERKDIDDGDTMALQNNNESSATGSASRATDPWSDLDESAGATACIKLRRERSPARESSPPTTPPTDIGESEDLIDLSDDVYSSPVADADAVPKEARLMWF
jgi:helicase required for RNAi-mediated heterochromatin assembly 1